MEKVRLVKKEGKTPAEAGLTQEEWKKYDTDGPNAQNSVWKGQEQYYPVSYTHLTLPTKA